MTSNLPNTISRDEARALGLKRFFPGKPCKHGHVAEHLVSDGQCVACRRERQAAWGRVHRTARVQKYREYGRAWWAAKRAAKLQKDPLAAKREERRLWWAAKRAAEREAARAGSELSGGAGLTGASEGNF
jgi:hypothetical protein